MTILTNENCNNMKNKLLLFLTLLFFVVSASAQGYCSSVLWNATLDSQGEIVRSWGAMQATISKSHFTSADIFNDLLSKDINLVEAGRGRWYLQHIPSTGPGTSGCPVEDYINVDVIPDLTPVPIPYNTTPSTPMFGFTTWPILISTNAFSTTCHSTR